MIRPTIITTMILASLLSCESQKTMVQNNDTPKQTSQSNMYKNVEILQGKDTQIADGKINITFKEIIEDSRCPEGVTCVWAGVAIVEIEVMTPSSRPRTIQLATMDLPNRNLKNTENVYGYNFTLKSVNPYPKESGKQNEAQKNILIDITKTE